MGPRRWRQRARGRLPRVQRRCSVRQTPTPSIVVGNLAPFTDYGFTVAAVDSRGYLGPATPVAALKTAMPPPTDGKVHAFMLASTDESFEALQRNYRRIGTLYPDLLPVQVEHQHRARQGRPAGHELGQAAPAFR